MYEELIKKIYGNVVPLPGQFNEDLSLNLENTCGHVRFLLDRGVNIFYLAHSASEFQYMTSDERLAVCAKVVKTVDGKGIVLSQALGNWFDEQATEAKAMYDLGADAIVVKPVPVHEGGKFFSCKYKNGSYSPKAHDGYYVDYIERFADFSGAPLVYHDKPFANGHGLSMEGLERIVDIDNVVCLKAHVPEVCVMQQIYSTFNDRVAIYDGFGKTMQMWSLIWGATARHTCWSWFDPINDKSFFDAVKAGDLNTANELVNREWPMVRAIQQTGFAGYKYVMQLLNIPSGPVRIPGQELDAGKRAMLKRAVTELGLGN